MKNLRFRIRIINTSQKYCCSLSFIQLINYILFSANLDLVSELFSIEIHVITDNRLALASVVKHIYHFYSKEAF